MDFARTLKKIIFALSLQDYKHEDSPSSKSSTKKFFVNLTRFGDDELKFNVNNEVVVEITANPITKEELKENGYKLDTIQSFNSRGNTVNIYSSRVSNFRVYDYWEYSEIKKIYLMIKRGRSYRGSKIYYFGYFVSPTKYVIQSVYEFPHMLRFISKVNIETEEVMKRIREKEEYIETIPDSAMSMNVAMEIWKLNPDLLRFTKFRNERNFYMRAVEVDYRVLGMLKGPVREGIKDVIEKGIINNIRSYKYLQNRSLKTFDKQMKTWGAKGIKYTLGSPKKVSKIDFYNN